LSLHYNRAFLPSLFLKIGCIHWSKYNKFPLFDAGPWYFEKSFPHRKNLRRHFFVHQRLYYKHRWSIAIGVSIDTDSIPFPYSFFKVTPIRTRYWVSVSISILIPILTTLSNCMKVHLSGYSVFPEALLERMQRITIPSDGIILINGFQTLFSRWQTGKLFAIAASSQLDSLSKRVVNLHIAAGYHNIPL
jgi:hypothetical protein